MTGQRADRRKAREHAGTWPEVSAVSDVQSIGTWATNAELIADVATLGWLAGDLSVLDATYGLGRFWTKYRPPLLTGVDLNARKSPSGESVDFRHLPFADRSFDVVVFDPPYKLNGTPSLEDFDDGYGVDEPSCWQDRMGLIADGTRECSRVARKHLLVKCQDQVVSGKMRWQTDVVTAVAYDAGFRKADRFDLRSKGIPQPAGRRQVHARHSASQLLVFTRGTQDNGAFSPGGAGSCSDAGATALPGFRRERER